MVRDLNRPMEPARKRAERKWCNNALSTRFKKMKATGEGSEEFLIRDGKKYFANEVPKPPKEELRPADVLENPRPKVDRFERKFVKDIKEMMEGHKQQNMAFYAAAIRHQKRRIMIEMIKRLEARIAQREGAKT
jgi:hypothetical protein